MVVMVMMMMAVAAMAVSAVAEVAAAVEEKYLPTSNINVILTTYLKPKPLSWVQYFCNRNVNIGIIFLSIGNSQQWLYNTQKSKSDWLFNTQPRRLQSEKY